MRTVTMYSRPDCGACDEALAQLEELAREGAIAVSVVDVSGSSELEERFAAFVPVIELDGEVVCELGLDRAALLARLGTFPA